MGNKKTETESKVCTVFCQINALGAEADNEPLTLSNFTEIDNIISQVPTLKVLEVSCRYCKESVLICDYKQQTSACYHHYKCYMATISHTRTHAHERAHTHTHTQQLVMLVVT